MSILDTIRIPDEFVNLANDWYGDSGSRLYAIASTGNLTRGTMRPILDVDNEQDEHGRWKAVYRPATDLEWYQVLFSDLESELYRLVRWAKDNHHEDYDQLRRFAEWTDRQVQAINAEIESEESADV